MSAEELHLPRLLGPGLRYVFIGFNPGIESARRGHYYAFRGNVFWRQMHESGMVPHPVTHEDDRDLFENSGIGFVDLCSRPTVAAKDLSPAELREGAMRLLGELIEHRPKVAVFAGRGVFNTFGRHALGLSAGQLRGRSDGAQPERLPGDETGKTVLYVIPSSSGLASGWHRERLELLRRLARDYR
ncbi:MAG: mismatch-specific DNA-glycosylase [Dehalococcoidia bacterium]